MISLPARCARRAYAATLAVCLLAAPALPATDWPQWLGPKRDGGTDEKVAPWKDGLKIAWKAKVGEGHCGPIVADKMVFLHTRTPGSDTEEVSAFDAGGGALLWQKSYKRGKFSSIFGNGPRATPSYDAGKVYTFGVTGILTCLDAKDKGAILWQRDTLKDFKAANLFFGVSCSPLIDQEKLLMNVGGKGASIVAFDKADGKVIWKSLDDKASYASPIIYGAGAERTALFLTHAGLVAVAVKDGAIRWRLPFEDKLAESSTTPVKIGDTIIASSITRGTVGLHVEGADKVVKDWEKTDLTCYFSTPVAVGTDHVFLVAGTPPPSLSAKATLHCVEVKSGKSLWRRPNVGSYHASLLRTGDGKLLLLEEKGDLVLLDPNPKEYRELARANVCGKTWAHPALANGRLYVRDNGHLYCVELKGE
ncbi:MAG: PQQ-binding-like beta-propeller repeat protein [Gemmataceae bacterium]